MGPALYHKQIDFDPDFECPNWWWNALKDNSLGRFRISNGPVEIHEEEVKALTKAVQSVKHFFENSHNVGGCNESSYYHTFNTARQV